MRVCKCDCHAFGPDDRLGCEECAEADAEMLNYYLGKDRTARSLIEALVGLANKGRIWLEEK